MVAFRFIVAAAGVGAIAPTSDAGGGRHAAPSRRDEVQVFSAPRGGDGSCGYVQEAPRAVVVRRQVVEVPEVVMVPSAPEVVYHAPAPRFVERAPDGYGCSGGSFAPRVPRFVERAPAGYGSSGGSFAPGLAGGGGGGGINARKLKIRNSTITGIGGPINARKLKIRNSTIGF